MMKSFNAELEQTIEILKAATSFFVRESDPRNRRCALSSVTSFERDGERWREVAYAEPAAVAGAIDVGAV